MRIVTQLKFSATATIASTSALESEFTLNHYEEDIDLTGSTCVVTTDFEDDKMVVHKVNHGKSAKVSRVISRFFLARSKNGLQWQEFYTEAHGFEILKDGRVSTKERKLRWAYEDDESRQFLGEIAKIVMPQAVPQTPQFEPWRAGSVGLSTHVADYLATLGHSVKA